MNDVTLKVQQDNGVNYWHYIPEVQSAGIMAIGEDKIILKGDLRITLIKNSYKYGEELQVRILAKKNSGHCKIRNKSSWDTAEINIPISELPNILKALNQFHSLVKKDKEEDIMNESQKELFEQPKDVESSVWQPKVDGEFIEGILVQKIPQEHELSARYHIDLFGSGNKMIWGTAVLDQRMTLVSVGDYVKVTYKGKVKTKDSKREVHIWKVESAKRKELKNQLF